MTSPDPSRPLDLTWTVNEVLREHPAAIRAFNAFGVDACCGGAASLRQAAQASSVLPEVLLFAVQSLVNDEVDEAVIAQARATVAGGARPARLGAQGAR